MYIDYLEIQSAIQEENEKYRSVTELSAAEKEKSELETSILKLEEIEEGHKRQLMEQVSFINVLCLSCLAFLCGSRVK
jgi:hypothetical protein